MQTISFPPIRFRFLAAAALLFPGQAAVAAAAVPVRELNVPPEGFTALFNGKDFTGWRVDPKTQGVWSIEDGVLKANGRVEQWQPDIETVKTYRDFVLRVDYRTPTVSDSGIFIRGLVPVLEMGRREQINIGPGRMGHPLSFHYLTPDIKLKAAQFPRVKGIRPQVGVWHTLELTFVGRTLSIEVDGEVILREFEYPEGLLSMEPSPIGLQKHVRESIEGKMSDMPIEFRNIFIKELNQDEAADARGLNVPPEGFTALSNGKDLTGWQVTPEVKEAWTIEDGVLKAHHEIKDWGADLTTEKKYRDFVLLVDFKFPTISDSGIWFWGIPEIMGGMEQFNLMSIYGTGNLDSLDHLPKDVQLSFRDAANTPFFYCQPEYYHLKDPPVRYTDPQVGVWHTVKLTLIGRTLSAEFDGQVIQDRFEYPEGTISMKPAPIRLQKHVPQTIAGKLYKECPIEFRNIFIKEIEPSESSAAGSHRRQTVEGKASPRSGDRSYELLARIDASDLPEGYEPAKHQEYVDRRWPELSPEQSARVNQLWKEKQAIDPNMPNRGFSFVKILAYVAEDEKLPAEDSRQKKPNTDDPAKSRGDDTPEER